MFLSGHYSQLTNIEARFIWLCALGNLETWIDFCPERPKGWTTKIERLAELSLTTFESKEQFLCVVHTSFQMMESSVSTPFGLQTEND